MENNSLLSLQIKQYIEQNILPLYNGFDKAHDSRHANTVIAESLVLAQQFDVDINMVYVIAAYHDLGLCKNRKYHHIHSGEILLADKQIANWFTVEQLEIMKQAIEDHRASIQHPPRSIYGKIVAEADRDIVPETIIRRTIQFGLKQFPEQTDAAFHFERTKQHIQQKYGENGYLKLYLHSQKNQHGLLKIREILKNQKVFIATFERVFQEENLPK